MNVLFTMKHEKGAPPSRRQEPAPDRFNRELACRFHAFSPGRDAHSSDNSFASMAG